MSTRSFVHLHCHSHYSLLDGASPIDKLIRRAKEHGMNALAITDHGNLHGALEFYRKAKDAGINPIIGYEAYIAPGSRFTRDGGTLKENSYHLTLLAQNRTGYKNLVKLASKAYLEGFYFKPRIDKEILQEFNEGIFCLSGCVSGELSRTLLNESSGSPMWDEAVAIAQWFQQTFGERYFLEIQNNGLEIQRLAMERTVEIANRVGLPLVATSDAHYVNREDAEAQDILLCINTGRFRTDKNRMRMEGNEFFLRSPEEMYEALPGFEAALQQSQTIADSVEIELELGKRHFPSYTLPPEKSADEFLRELCLKGLKERYAGDPERIDADGNLTQVVMDRLDRELGVIGKLGFPNYFLIVWDFVREARERGIPATARGSGVGSLVSYALYLSHVCPLRYDLLFERFLDESRKEAPDIDIDFCKDRRGEIIQYVKDKYGEANVAQIGTFGTLAAKAAIRDVGRALGMPIPAVDRICAAVPEVLHISLEKAIETGPDLQQMYENEPDVRELLDLARKIEGLARNVGTHAAAVVIADKPLVEYVPLCRVSGKEETITQWAMGDVEAAGLLKMDFLGLRNLTILAKAVELIEQTTGEKIDPYRFPLDDAEAFALLCRGETKGVFQLESGGIRDLLQKMKPDHFRDIIATNALYRPGPLEGGMVDEYIQVKHGRKQAEYLTPVMKEVLEETHGVMVYQEQVMRIINRLGNIPLSNAYSCIKAISKKKEKDITKYEGQFLEGAVTNGLTKTQAVELFEMIKKFAGYGFNKCVVGETEIIDAQTGERTTVQSLFDRRRPFQIHALGEDSKLRVRSVEDVVWNGRKPVFTLRTRQGRTLVATGNHPLRTLDGWKNLEALQPGDRIAAPRRLPVAGSRHWPRHELVALAGLISEGNTCHPTCLYFFNNDRVLIDDFVEAVEQFPDTVARIHTRRETRHEVCVSTGADTRFTTGQTPWNKKGGRSPFSDTAATATVEPPAVARSGAYRWAEQLGLLGLKADAKRVPAEVFELVNEDIELFLGRLWSGDGFVGADGQTPYYATSSPKLADDVRTLLLRLGIVCGVRGKQMRYRYRGEARVRPGYTVHLVGNDSIDAFVERVLPHALGREEQVERYRQLRRTTPTGLTSRDTLPAEIRRWVNEERVARGLGWRELEQQSGVSVRELCRKSEGKKRGFRRGTVARLAAFFASTRLEQAAHSDLFWDTIASIEPAGVADTYDLTVAEDHNFIADGLIVHNSHSTAYALIAYMTAYLKAHYSVEFMAALLSGDKEGRNFKTKDSLVEHLEDCRRMNITVVPPHVNASSEDFTVADGKIHFALSAIKGCGAGAAAAIEAARQTGGPFTDLFDFCERVDPASCNRAAIETLVKAGAFDGLGGHRAQLLAAVDRALQAGAAVHSDRKSGQKGLFDVMDDDQPAAAAKASLPSLPDWESKEQLAAEKEVLGFYLSSHPLAEHEKTLATYCSHTIDQLASLPVRTEVMIGGSLAALKFSQTKNPRPDKPSKYVMFDLEDMTGIVRCILWPDDFVTHGHRVAADAILVVRGSIDRRGEEVNLIVNELIPLEDLAARFTRGMVVRIMEEQHTEQGLADLYEILRGYPGPCELQLVLCLADGSKVHLKSNRTRVELNPEMRARVDNLLGPGNVKLLSAPQRSGPPAPAGGRRAMARR